MLENFYFMGPRNGHENITLGCYLDGSYHSSPGYGFTRMHEDAQETA